MNLKPLILIFLCALFALSANAQNTYDEQDKYDFDLVDQLPSKENPQVNVVEGGLEISIGDNQRSTFLIFSITGQLAKKIEVVGNSNRIDLPKGCYIVKCDKWSKKLVVR